MTYLLVWIFPLLAAVLSWIMQNPRLNNRLILIHSILHLGFAIALILPSSSVAAYFEADRYAALFLLISAILYLAAALYTYAFKTELKPRQSSIYAICLMAFVASMDSANLSMNLGVIWVFVETTTLASAMLISFEHHKQSLEAAWKYLFICSIGIALAFVGILLLIIAQGSEPSLVFAQVLGKLETISPFWLRLSFVFMMIGFGTKVGLAPMHFWLPDAHSEAPAQISALLSGALLNTALLPLLRMQSLMQAAGEGALANEVFLFFGFASIFIAAVFIIKIKNYKRMLAYSSIENMGIILIAFALGKAAGMAGIIHILGHSLIKASLFLTAGNLYAIFKNKDYESCSSLLSRHPQSGWLWLLGFAFIIGLPPSPLFFSEFFITISLLGSSSFIALGLWVLLLAVIALGLGRAFLTTCMGEPKPSQQLPLLAWLPGVVLLLLAVLSPLLILWII